MATAILSVKGSHGRKGSNGKKAAAKENGKVASGRWVAQDRSGEKAHFKGYSYSFEHISEGIKRIVVTFLSKITKSLLGDTIVREKAFQRQFVVAFLQFRHVVVKYSDTGDYAKGASVITEIAYKFALNIQYTIHNNIRNDCYSRISEEIPYIIDDLIRSAKADNNLYDDIFNEKRLEYLVCIRDELWRRMDNYEEERDPKRLLGLFLDYKSIDPNRRVEIGKLIEFITSSAFTLHGGGLPGTAQICLSAIADALHRRPVHKRVLAGATAEITEFEHSDIVSQSIAVLAPHVLKLTQDIQMALRSTVEGILKELPLDREAELRRLLSNGALTRETLPLLSLKTRAAALKIHYVTCEPWDPRPAEERKASRPLKERTPATFVAWLDRNLPDRRELELVASDLGFVDADAYRKIRNWKTEKIIESAEAFGLKEGSRAAPSQEQLHSLVAVRDDARWLLRTLDRARHG